jgi:hypothetical protein
MSKSRVYLSATVAAILALVAPAALACTSDAECKGDRVCQAGECVSPGARDGGAGEGRPAEVGEGPRADANVSLFVNSLGVLQFGLTPTLEVGSRFAVNARVLLANTGALSYLIADTDTLHFSFGAGPGFRYYFGPQGNLRGGYIGALALYIAWEEQYQEETLFKTRLLAPMAEGGYRWVFGNGFTLGLGLTAGPALVLDKTSEAVSGYAYPEANDASTTPIGFVHLDVGFLL